MKIHECAASGPGAGLGRQSAQGTCNPQEVEAGGRDAQGQPGIQETLSESKQTSMLW